MNNKNDRHNAANLNINMPKKETNVGCVEITIDEFSYKGVSFKGFRAHAHAEFTDEKVRVETDACMKLFLRILDEFAPSGVKLIEKESEVSDARKGLYEAQTKECEARTKKYEAEAKAAEHKCNCKAGAEDAQL